MKLSVWMSAYNHEQYIAKAIDGVLMQQTDFDVEIVIGEDCSTDSTRKIILDFSDKNPGKFKLLLPEKNLGMIPMFKATYPLCDGKYIAWLDGDDYWTDPLKLQKQVNFMEAHPEFVMCFHNVILKNEINHTEEIKELPYPMNADFSLSLSHFCSHNPVSACSVVYRNVLPEKLPDWFFELPFPDLAFYFLLTEKGKIQYLDEVMGVYRLHENGAWSGNNKYDNYRKLTRFYSEINRFTQFRNDQIITNESIPIFRTLLYLAIEKHKYKEARTLFRHIFFEGNGYWIRHSLEMTRLCIFLFVKHAGKEN
jgi:glycosyltransferase involved in cell wall biosynthesis